MSKEDDEERLPELPLPADEAIILNKDYVILDVEKFISEVQALTGVRVTLDGGSDNLCAIALWTRDIVGRSSKCGAFIVALGSRSADWVGKTIQFVKWSPKDRQLKVV